jgi:hypothetical protein
MSQPRLRSSLRRALLFATMLAAVGLFAGCDRANKTAASRQATSTPNGRPGSERPVELANYPPTPDLVVAVARQAAAEGRWSLYYSFLTPESVEKQAKSYLQAAATDQPPSWVRDQAKAREQIAYIKLVLYESGIDLADVEAARDDPDAQMRIVERFGSPQAFATKVMERFEPNGDKDLLPIRSAQWTVQGDTASGMFLGPEGEQRFLTLRRIAGRWSVER